MSLFIIRIAVRWAVRERCLTTLFKELRREAARQWHEDNEATREAYIRQMFSMDAPQSTPGQFYEALKVANLEHSAMSWGGFNLFGDQKSIKELQRIQNEAANVEAYWRPEHLRMRAMLAAVEAKP